MPRNRVGKIATLNFDSDPLTLDLGPFLPKIAKIGQKAIAFFLEMQEEIGSILRYLDSPMAKVFSLKYLLFFDFSHLQGGTELKLDQKCKLWVSPVSVEI